MSPPVIAYLAVGALNGVIMLALIIRIEIQIRRHDKRFGRYGEDGSGLPELFAIVAMVFGLAALVLSMTSQTAPTH